MLTRRQIPLNSLRSFEVTARHLNMGVAAAELGVTQSAVSQQIKLLEVQLDTMLFERHGSRLKLSPAGARLLPVLRESFDRIAYETQNLIPGQLEGELTVGCTASSLGSWLLSSLPEFWKMYPGIKLNFEMIERLQTQLPANIDVAICYGEPTVEEGRLQELVHYDFFPICSPSYLNSMKRSLVRPKQLAECVLLIDDEGEEWRRWAESMKVDISIDTNGLHVPMTMLALKAALFGMGVALADRLEVADDLSNGRLVRIFKEAEHKASHPYFIVSPSAQRVNARSEVFVRWLTTLFRAA